MKSTEAKSRLKKLGWCLWIAGTVSAVWFGATFVSPTLPPVPGESFLCAIGMLICSVAAGGLSLSFSQGFDGSEFWDWLAMFGIAAALILIGQLLGDRNIVGASISHAVAVIGGGMVGLALPHRPHADRSQQKAANDYPTKF